MIEELSEEELFETLFELVSEHLHDTLDALADEYGYDVGSEKGAVAMSVMSVAAANAVGYMVGISFESGTREAFRQICQAIKSGVDDGIRDREETPMLQ